MSVSLLIKYHNPGKRSRLVPIATEDTFEQYWQTASSRLALKWVPIFQSGLPLRNDDIPLIVAELDRLRDYWVESGQHDIPREIAEQLLSRVKNLLIELKGIQEDPDAEGYIS